MDLLEKVKFSRAPGVGPSDRMVNLEIGLASGWHQGLRTSACGCSSGSGREPERAVVSFLSGLSKVRGISGQDTISAGFGIAPCHDWMPPSFTSCIEIPRQGEDVEGDFREEYALTSVGGMAGVEFAVDPLKIQPHCERMPDG